MTLNNTKLTVAAAHVVVVGGLAVLSGVTSSAALVAFAALAVLPAGALLVLWNDPPQTLSETIQSQRALR